jgi:hypothetical protein
VTSDGLGGFGAGDGLTVAAGGGGGGAGLGGAVFNYGGTVSVTDSTLAGNTARGGTGARDGLGFGGALFNLNGRVTIASSTLASNTGGAVFNLGDGGEATQAGPALPVQNASDTIDNSILANSTVGSDYAAATFAGGSPGGAAAQSSSGSNNIVRDVTVPGAPAGYSWSPATTFAAFAGTSSQVDPQLGALGNNGGPTRTLLPLPGSPAIDAGGATALLTDQRGLARVGGGATDLGAVEVVKALGGGGPGNNPGVPTGPGGSIQPPVPPVGGTVAPPADAPPPPGAAPRTLATAAPLISVLVNRGRRQEANGARLTVVLDGAMTVLPGAFRVLRRRGKGVPVRVRTVVSDGQTFVTLHVRRFINGQPIRGRVRILIQGNRIQDGTSNTLGADFVSRPFRLRGHRHGRGRKTAVVLAAPLTVAPH